MTITSRIRYRSVTVGCILAAALSVTLAPPAQASEVDTPQYVAVMNGQEFQLTAPVNSDNASRASATTAPGCAGKDADWRINAFRHKEFGDAPSGVATLKCGIGTEDGWGWSHIAYGHTSDWSVVAAPTPGTWDQMAQWAIEQTLLAPAAAKAQKNETYRYTAPVEIRDSQTGEVAAEWLVLVSFGRVNQNIITAYPVTY